VTLGARLRTNVFVPDGHLADHDRRKRRRQQKSNPYEQAGLWSSPNLQHPTWIFL